MQSNTQPYIKEATSLIYSIYYSPTGYVDSLEESTASDWFLALGMGCAGYTLYGLSLAMAPISSQGGGSKYMFPFVFAMALLISLPALYIFHAFMGSRLTPRQIAGTGLVALVVPAGVLAGFAPINWFMSVTLTSPSTLLGIQYVALLVAAVLSYVEVSKTLPQLEPASACGNEASTVGADKSATLARRRKGLMLLWFFLYMGVLLKLLNWIAR